MPCMCGMSDSEADDIVKEGFIDVNAALDLSISLLLRKERLSLIQMDIDQAKHAFEKIVKHKLWGCDESKSSMIDEA